MSLPVGFVPWARLFQLGKRKKFPSNPTLISRVVTPSPAPETRSQAILLPKLPSTAFPKFTVPLLSFLIGMFPPSLHLPFRDWLVEPVVSSPSAYSKGRLPALLRKLGTQQRKNLTCALVLWAMPCLQNLSYFTRSRNRIATSTSAAATGTSLIDLVHPPILLISRVEERGLLHLCFMPRVPTLIRI